MGSPPYLDTAGHTDDFGAGSALLSTAQCVDKKHTSRQVPVLHALCTKNVMYIKKMQSHTYTHPKKIQTHLG